MLLMCKTTSAHILNIYRVTNASQAVPQASIQTGPLRRFEAVIFKNRIFLSYLTEGGQLYYTKSLLSVDQDSSINAGVFNYFQGVTSFDVMLDTAAANISSVKVVLYNRDEKRILLLEFSSNVDYSTRTLARSGEDFTEVCCADEFQTNLTCIAKKASGDRCVFQLLLGSQVPANSQIELSCRMDNYLDFENERTLVLDSRFSLSFGQLNTRRFRGFIFYRLHANRSLPILASGSLDLNFTEQASIPKFMVASNTSVYPGLLLCVLNREGIQFYQVRNISLNVTNADVTYAVSKQLIQMLSNSSIVFEVLNQTSTTLQLKEMFREKIKLTSQALFRIGMIMLGFCLSVGCIVFLCRGLFVNSALETRVTIDEAVSMPSVNDPLGSSPARAAELVRHTKELENGELELDDKHGRGLDTAMLEVSALDL